MKHIDRASGKVRSSQVEKKKETGKEKEKENHLSSSISHFHPDRPAETYLLVLASLLLTPPMVPSDCLIV